MTEPEESTRAGLIERVREEARERSLRLLDFLEAFYARRFPAIHDIGDFNDERITATDVPDVPGITFTRGGDVWLVAELLDLPPLPAIPANLEEWLDKPVTARERPSIRHPSQVSRRLLEVLADPIVVDGLEVDLDDLDGPQLASMGITGIAPGQVDAAAIAADDELTAAAQELEQWMTASWEPWSTQYLEIEIGRSFYKRLFELRMRMERERDLAECIWGFARLRWQPEVDGRKVSVDFPLLCVPIEFNLEQRSGVISLGPVGAAEIDATWAAGIGLSDAPGFNDQRVSAEQVELDPWGPQMPALVRSLLRSIDQDGVMLEPGEIGRAGTKATVDAQEWVLFVRRRQANYREFLAAQRSLYNAADAVVPDPFAALVIDEPSALDAEVSFGSDSEGAKTTGSTGDQSERLLLPLATNEQQMQILMLAQTRAGVTSQGPPGTGKSHTIANLISHYVAHGRRVLVTAEKEQALKVLIDKVPAEIRQLCVPVLGADAAARSRLQATITTIADAAHLRPDRGSISRFESELDDLEAKYAATTNALKARRAAETGEAPNLPPGRVAREWTPSTAAQWLAENRGRLAGIPDALALDVRPPLTSAELVELQRLCTLISEDEAEEALSLLPDPMTLPSGARLGHLRLEAEDLRSFLSDVDDRVSDWTRVDAVGSDALSVLTEELEAWADWHTKIAGTWLARVLADSADPSLRVGWDEFCNGAATERESVLAASRSLAAHSVAIVTPSPGAVPERAFVEALNEARTRIAAGKSIGIMQKSARRALEACSIDERTPANLSELDLVFAEITRRIYRQRLTTRWANLAPRVGAPSLTEDRPVEDQLGEMVAAAQSTLAWRPTTWPALSARIQNAGIRVPAEAGGADVTVLAEVCRSLGRRAQLVQITKELEALETRLQLEGGVTGASRLWAQLLEALRSNADDRWDALRGEASRLAGRQEDAARRRALYERLTAVAPRFAAQVAELASPVDAERHEAAWAWRQLEVWFERLDDGPEPAKLQAELEQISKDLRRVTTNLVAVRAWAAVADGLDDRRRTALNRFTTANTKLGKGTGRYAPMWQAELRRAMDDAKDAVPVWIMPIHKVISNFRPAKDPPFDVIIVDEASQVGLLDVAVLGLAKRAIVVGDDQQTSPENVGQEQQDIFDLIDVHLGVIGDRLTRFAPTNSLYDVARQRFPQIVQLREHFRCLPRIIQFSNHRWYNDTIVALRDKAPHPGWQPLGTVFAPGGVRRRSDDTNTAEAEAIVELVADMVSDPAYDEMTFGVVTLLGGGQAPLISGLLLDRLGPTVMEERAMRVGDPASFQGDERDVVLLSMVVAHDPEGGRIGAMNTPAAARRVNVAASRARNQLWLVHSVGPESLHRDDPRRALLEHCLVPMEIAAASAAFEKTESQFERDVLTRILDAGYTQVTTQYAVGGFRIDIVIEGPDSRLAVECDGDYWHGPERWDEDRARQTVLERAGWTFERIRGSAFYRDRTRAVEPLLERLESLGIPKGDWASSGAPMPVLRREWPDDFTDRPGPPRAVASPEIAVPGDSVQHSDPFLRARASTRDTPRGGTAAGFAPVGASASHSNDGDQLDQRRHELTSDPNEVLSALEASVGSDLEGSEDRSPTDGSVLITATPETASPSQGALIPSHVGEQRPPAIPTSLVAKPRLRAHIRWMSRPMPDAVQASTEELMAALIEIVHAEGPMLARCAYLACHQAAGGVRVGKDIRSAFNRAASRAVRSHLLTQIEDDRPGQMDKTLFIPGSKPVVVRELGPRSLYDVPLSEVQTLMGDLRVSNATPARAARAILDAYGLHKLTQKATAFIEECQHYSWLAQPDRSS